MRGSADTTRHAFQPTREHRLILPLSGLVPSTSRFRGWWGEGTPGEAYEDGVFSIYAVTALDAYANYTAVIDRSSSLKSSCGHPVSYRFPEVGIGGLAHNNRSAVLERMYQYCTVILRQPH